MINIPGLKRWCVRIRKVGAYSALAQLKALDCDVDLTVDLPCVH